MPHCGSPPGTTRWRATRSKATAWSMMARRGPRRATTARRSRSSWTCRPTPVRSPSTRRTAVADRLYRSREDRVLAGVAGGVAEMVDADPSLIRVVWAVLIVLTGGLALLVYVVMAIVVPEAPIGEERG